MGEVLLKFKRMVARKTDVGILGHNCRVPRAHLMGTVLDMDARGADQQDYSYQGDQARHFT